MKANFLEGESTTLMAFINGTRVLAGIVIFKAR